MKITRSGGVKGASSTSKTSKTTESSDTSFGDMVKAKEAGAASATSAPQSIAKVEALLAVQASEDPTERASRGRMHRRSMTILDELEKLRMGMLKGDLTVGDMIDIADVVASHREKVADPTLTSVMDEIDLRAQVELAKMRVALDAVQANENKTA